MSHRASLNQQRLREKNEKKKTEKIISSKLSSHQLIQCSIKCDSVRPGAKRSVF